MHMCIPRRTSVDSTIHLIKVPYQEGSDGQTSSARTLIRITRCEIYLCISGPLRARSAVSCTCSRAGSRPRSKGTR